MQTHVSVPIAIEKYKENVLYDVVLPMEIGHIILGRPWKFDHNTLHEGNTNKIILYHFKGLSLYCDLLHLNM